MRGICCGSGGGVLMGGREGGGGGEIPCGGGGVYWLRWTPWCGGASSIHWWPCGGADVPT